MEKFVPVNLAYNLFESEKGSNPNLTPIIFLHGLAADKNTWRNMPSIVAERTNRKVYTYDARNYGDSEYTDETSCSLNVDDLFHFMDTVNTQKAIIFGHSMGGYTVLNAALRKPERVALVMIEDTFLSPPTDEVLLFSGNYAKKLAEEISRVPTTVTDVEEAKNIVLDNLFNNASEELKKWFPKESLQKIYVPIKKGPDGNYVANFNAEALHSSSLTPDKMKAEPVGLYEGPAVFLWGTKSDLNVKKNESNIRRYFPKAEFIMFEGASHSLHAEFREKTVDTIIEVLNRYNVE